MVHLHQVLKMTLLHEAFHDNVLLLLLTLSIITEYCVHFYSAKLHLSQILHNFLLSPTTIDVT